MSYNLCIIKPNKSVYSETFIQNHIDCLSGNISVLYGGAFPIYQQDGSFLIKSKLDLLIYIFQKRILKSKNIPVREKALTNYFEVNKINVVLAEYGMVGASIYKVCEKAKVPLIIHFHGADAHHLPTIKKYLKEYKSAFKYASAIVCVSLFMKQALNDLGAPEEKLILNPYGVDLKKFIKAQPEQAPDILFFAGRFVEKKAPLTLIEAFSIVKKEVSDAKLILAGNGPLLMEAKELAKKLALENDIEFPGVYSHQQVLQKMKQVRAFVQHSVIAKDGDSEGTPNSILEASASGLPVISTFHAGINEAVIDGVTGLLSNENDVNAFAENMIKVFKDKDLAKKLGEMGADHIKKNYDLKTRISTLDDIIKKAIITK